MRVCVYRRDNGFWLDCTASSIHTVLSFGLVYTYTNKIQTHTCKQTRTMHVSSSYAHMPNVCAPHLFHNSSICFGTRVSFFDSNTSCGSYTIE